MTFYIIAQNQMQHDLYYSSSASLRLCAKNLVHWFGENLTFSS